MSGVSGVSLAKSISNDIDKDDTSKDIEEVFYFGKVQSSGYASSVFKDSPLKIIVYSDENATTTITSLFKLHSITIKGNHTLTVYLPSKRGIIDLPLYYGDCILKCRALMVKITYQ